MPTRKNATAPTVDYAPVRWGVMGVADIAIHKVIPAMQASAHTPVVAIASRDLDKSRTAAKALGIEKAYGSYEELLADPDIDAIYNPLPNHMHVPWSVKAAAAGKHVLCEKPLSLTTTEARELLAVRDRTGVQIAEAFMVRTHPQWAAVRELIAEGRIGELRLVVGHFSYFRRDPRDIRSNPEWGGGALMDIGCYPITLSRWLFDEEPTEVIATLDRDPDMKIDRLVSGLLRFPSGQASFTCAGQLVSHQRMQVYGTEGRIEIEIPYNAPADRECRIFVDDGSKFAGEAAEVISLPAVDQYRLQGERFSEAVRGVGTVPVTLEDSIGNMAVIDALFRSETSARWEQPY
ncbi:MAG: oxidoreductase domain protein [Gemmatimonadetes bacterium]|nr:oxidoreductase domain protein [Gemmatimonadota bacterium]